MLIYGYNTAEGSYGLTMSVDEDAVIQDTRGVIGFSDPAEYFLSTGVTAVRVNVQRIAGIVASWNP